MTKIICKQCGKDHFVEQREINRGGGIFCSNRCGTIYSNAHRKYLDLVCQNPNCNLSDFMQYNLNPSAEANAPSLKSNAVKTGLLSPFAHAPNANPKLRQMPLASKVSQFKLSNEGKEAKSSAL